MTIHIEELTFDTIIGILDFERVTPQTIIVNVKIDYQYINKIFINYADVISLIERQMIEEKYELLETALEELIQNITSTYSQIDTLSLRITKPNIINNAKVGLSTRWSKI